jgi:WD40 repeat protein
VKLWDLATGNELVALDWQGAWVKSVAFTADGKTLAAGGGGEVRLYDVTAFSARHGER